VDPTPLRCQVCWSSSVGYRSCCGDNGSSTKYYVVEACNVKRPICPKLKRCGTRRQKRHMCWCAKDEPSRAQGSSVFRKSRGATELWGAGSYVHRPSPQHIDRSFGTNRELFIVRAHELEFHRGLRGRIDQGLPGHIRWFSSETKRLYFYFLLQVCPSCLFPLSER